MSSVHPLVHWYREVSGWADSPESVPEETYFDELFVSAWNYAIECALNCVVIDGNPEIAREKILKLKYEAKNEPPAVRTPRS